MRLLEQCRLRAQLDETARRRAAPAPAKRSVLVVAPTQVASLDAARRRRDEGSKS
jgi:hypothetical protein